MEEGRQIAPGYSSGGIEASVPIGRPPTDMAGRLWARIDKSVEGCWIWPGTKTLAGYGQITARKKRHYTHRVAWESANGPIPEGHVLDHLCRNPACCRPDHLEPVTHAENLRRGIFPQGLATHCKNGHEFTPENTNLEMRTGKVRPGRICLECKRERGREYMRRRRAPG